MRGKIAQIIWQVPDSENHLKQAYLRERDSQVKPRLHLLWLVRQGKQIKEAATVVGVHLRTARQWVAWYREGGLNLVRHKRRAGKGRAARLSVAQQQALWKWTCQTEVFTAVQACQWVQEQFGVAYTQAGMYGLLARLKIKQKVPRPINAKADAHVQDAYKKGA